jgi:isocitrate dehydrogenase
MVSKMAEPREMIEKNADGLLVPDHPIIPFIEGDGIGPEIWAASQDVFDGAVSLAYGGRRKIVWEEVLAGEKARQATGIGLPEETLQKIAESRVAIKGPLSTAVAVGGRSLNVALRKLLDLYACVRPVRWFEGVPSPVHHPEHVNMVVFRENTEDVYAGVEFEALSTETKILIEFLQRSFPEEYKKIRFPDSSALGIKPISRDGSERIVRAAIRWAIANKRSRVTLLHKGNIMKYTEGGFMTWGYDVARKEFGSAVSIGNPSQSKLIVNDMIVDAALAQVLLTPREFDVIVCTNLNGDYLSDALAAQVGGLGIAPGANINFDTGAAVFEATHGTAPNIAGQNAANPCSLILSGEMMLRYLGWVEAADLVLAGVERAIASRKVTPDFADMMRDAERTGTREFARNILGIMERSIQ